MHRQSKLSVPVPLISSLLIQQTILRLLHWFYWVLLRFPVLVYLQTRRTHGGVALRSFVEKFFEKYQIHKPFSIWKCHIVNKTICGSSNTFSKPSRATKPQMKNEFTFLSLKKYPILNTFLPRCFQFHHVAC